MKKDIWIFLETGKSGKIRELSLSLLNDCRALADSLGGILTAVAFSGDAQNAAAAAGDCGADRLLLADKMPVDPASALADLAEQRHPWAILAAATAQTREWLPQTAARLNTGFAPDCTAVAFDSQQECLVWTRPVLGESVLCDVVCVGYRPQIGTVRTGGLKKKLRESAAPVPVIRFTPAADAARVRVLELLQELSNDGVDLENADIIVSGGKGVGGPHGFAPLRELAAALGGAVGASRTTVDRGWISKAHQVGQTGHTVAPKLYIACGISGAIQHLTGMLGSGTIVAINSDPEARIFRYADYCVVGDLFEVVPALTREVLRHRS